MKSDVKELAHDRAWQASPGEIFAAATGRKEPSVKWIFDMY
jgi:hypothetical protein